MRVATHVATHVRYAGRMSIGWFAYYYICAVVCFIAWADSPPVLAFVKFAEKVPGVRWTWSTAKGSVRWVIDTVLRRR